MKAYSTPTSVAVISRLPNMKITAASRMMLNRSSAGRSSQALARSSARRAV